MCRSNNRNSWCLADPTCNSVTQAVLSFPHGERGINCTSLISIPIQIQNKKKIRKERKEKKKKAKEKYFE